VSALASGLVGGFAGVLVGWFGCALMSMAGRNR
jgi:hypothetical protein